MGGLVMKDKFNNVSLYFKVREQVSIREAALILNNQDPYDVPPDEYGNNIYAIKNLLMEATQFNQLESMSSYSEENEGHIFLEFMEKTDLDSKFITSDSKVLTSDLAAWCDSKGIPHPFKAMSKKTTFEAQTPDLDLEKALAKIAKQEAEIETLNKKLELAISNHQHLHDEIVFPYSTPELVAMREAAIKFWVNLKDDSRPAFNQNTIALEIGELLELNSDNSGEPNRKALEYSRAIKPVEKRD